MTRRANIAPDTSSPDNSGSSDLLGGDFPAKPPPSIFILKAYFQMLNVHIILCLPSVADEPFGETDC